MKKERIGSTLESLFDELGETEEVMLLAHKKVVAEQLQEAMRERGVTPAEMARRMSTSRPAVYRMLDPAETGLTLDSLTRATKALGLDFEVRLFRRKARARRPAAPPLRKAAAR